MAYIISMASSKGGSAKTTSAAVLASELVRQRVPIALIDADPNRHLFNWAKKLNLPIVMESAQDRIIEDIKKAAHKSSIVLVDLEGSTNMTMAYSVSQSNLVLITCQPSRLDGNEVLKLNKFINDNSIMLNREIKKYVLFTKTSSAFVTKVEKKLIDTFHSERIEIFTTRLSEREAFRNIIEYNCLLQNLPSDNKREAEANSKAMDIANRLTIELIQKIEGSKA